MNKILAISLLSIFSISYSLASNSIQDNINKRIVIADIYCESFGERPDASMQGRTWNRLGGPFKDLYQIHVRQFLTGDIDLFKVIDDVNLFKRTWKNPSNQAQKKCQTVKAGKSILQHYNELHKAYCSVIGIKRDDQSPYFINNLYDLYSGRKDLNSLQKHFAKHASNNTNKSAKKCNGHQDKELSSEKKDSRITLNFKYPTRQEVVDSPVSKYANYRNKPFCGDGKNYDYAKLELAFNESVHSRIDKCINDLRGHKDFNCLKIDIKTKNLERE